MIVGHVSVFVAHSSHGIHATSARHEAAAAEGSSACRSSCPRGSLGGSHGPVACLLVLLGLYVEPVPVRQVDGRLGQALASLVVAVEDDEPEVGHLLARHHTLRLLHPPVAYANLDNLSKLSE